jgi:hypothetical protein
MSPRDFVSQKKKAAKFPLNVAATMMMLVTLFTRASL